MAPLDTGHRARLDQLAQEFADRCRRGERPLMREYVERYPDLADEICRLFPALAAAGRPEGEQRIGDYLIVRQVGKGGMGVVYEAEQLSLGRRVALKVLPVPATRDARALERFKREARAAARLHHTNIVPVFEVGQDGDAWFYAMQFIAGQPLDRVIDELRRLRAESRPDARRAPTRRDPAAGPATIAEDPPARLAAQSLLNGEHRPRSPDAEDEPSPAAVTDADGQPAGADTPVPQPRSGGDTAPIATSRVALSAAEAGRRPFFRSAARLGYQTATALAHAHARGVVHRDVKPSNLLLDAAGVVWVTDFGLAKTDDEALTHAGDIVGTIRYMAPERFRGECDARADVYALGLTLYELLTLQPAFDATDRLQLMEQVKTREPARLRSLDPRIPRDLETVVLKAIDKDPRRRYQTADDLGEDLRRFLADEPVRARRAGLPERAWRWCRRNPVEAALGSLLVSFLCAATASSVAVAFHFNRLADDKARAAEEAKEAGRNERAARDRAVESLGEAQAQRRRAEVSFGYARDALDRYLVQVSDNELLRAPGLQPLRRELLESALKFYQKFLRESGDAPELRVALATAHVRVARIYRDLGLHAEYRASAAEALALARVLAEERPGEVEARNALAEASRASGDFLKAIEIWKGLVDPADPRFQRELADCYNVLAVRAGSDNKLAESLRFHQEALLLRRRLVGLVDVPESYRDLGSTLNNLGLLLYRQNRLDEALGLYRDSLRYARIAHERAPHDVVAGQFLVIVLKNLGERDRAAGDRDAAVRWCQEAVDLAQHLLDENPALPRLYEVLFTEHVRLAGIHAERKDDDAVRKQARAVVGVADRHPRQGADNLYALATMRAWCAEALGRGAARRDPGADEQAALAVAALRDAVAAGYRDHRRAEGQAEFRALAGRADFQEAMGRLRDAGRAAELAGDGHPAAVVDRIRRGQEARALRDGLVRQDPKNPRHRADLAASHHAIGLLQLQVGQFDEAARALGESAALWKAVAAEPGNDHHRADLAAVRLDRGLVEWRAGRPAKALPLWRDAVAALEALAKAGPDDARRAARLAAAERSIGHAFASAGLWEEALPWTARAAERQPLASQRDASVHASLLWAAGNAEGYRDYCVRLFDHFGGAGTHELARALALSPRPPVEAGRVVALARRALRARPGDAGASASLALALYRDGEHREALDRLRQADLTGAAYWPLLAMVHDRLGDAAEARFWLGLAEHRHEQACRAHLGSASPSLPGLSWPPAAGWEDWPHFLALLREARGQVRGKGAGDPWVGLVRGRAFALLGREKDADEEFARAERAGSGGVEGWMVRGLARAQFGDHGRAVAAFDRAVEGAGPDPRPWIVRGRYHLERGQDAKADADLARAAVLAKGDPRPFLQAGWWVAGPYPEELQRGSPPERNPHPSRAVLDEEGKPRAWRTLPVEPEGRVELGLLFGGAEHISAYALNYVYSPDERAVTLNVGSDDTVRVWLNGQLVHEYAAGREAAPRQEAVHVTLKAGRNVLLVKVGNGIVEHRFYLSAGGTAFDRGLALAERGLWREAGEFTAKALAAEPALHPTDWVQDAILKRVAGDEAGYRRAAARLMDRYGRSANRTVLATVARACSLGPDAVAGVPRLTEMAPLERASGSAEVVHAALARVRAGKGDEAIRAVKEGAAEDWPVAWPVLALAHHRLGEKEAARRWLGRAGKWANESLDEALAGPEGKLPLGWMDWAEFQILWREARQALGPDRDPADEKLRRLETRARATRE